MGFTSWVLFIALCLMLDFFLERKAQIADSAMDFDEELFGVPGWHT